MSELYEKLYKENERLKDEAMRRKDYIRKWKKKFGYDDSVSFDKVLEDLLERSDNSGYAVPPTASPKSCPDCGEDFNQPRQLECENCSCVVYLQ